MLVDILPNWLEGKIKPQAQDDKKATYTKILTRKDSLIDWKEPAEYIERQIRALNPNPGTYTLYKGQVLKILKAEVINNKLIPQEVQLAGKKPTSFEDFLRGHKDYVEFQ